MSSRTVRRAAERKAAKLAAKAGIHSHTTLASAASPVTANEEEEQQQSAAEQQPLAATASAGATFGLSTEPEPAPQKRSNPISDAHLAANRANAKLSTGPTSAEGRAKSSMNAVKTGLTGRAVLLPGDDALAYQQHLHRFLNRFAPTNEEENSLVQSISDFEWRLLRILPLEASIWAVARIKLAGLHSDVSDPIKRQSLIDGEILLAYRKDLTNLTLQECHLRKQCAADTAKLEKLRADQREKHPADLLRAIFMYKNAKTRNLPFNPAFFGFVISNEDLEQYVVREQSSLFLKGMHSDLTEEQLVALMTQKRICKPPEHLNQIDNHFHIPGLALECRLPGGKPFAPCNQSL
jgi:hypothetical protein